MVKGILTLQKQGCKSYEMDVSDQILMNDIKADLECDPEAAQAAETRPQTTTAKQAEIIDATTEQRLNELKTLYDKGLISDKEYNAQRTRILNEL